MTASSWCWCARCAAARLRQVAGQLDRGLDQLGRDTLAGLIADLEQVTPSSLAQGRMRQHGKGGRDARGRQGGAVEMRNANIESPPSRASSSTTAISPTSRLTATDPAVGSQRHHHGTQERQDPPPLPLGAGTALAAPGGHQARQGQRQVALVPTSTSAPLAAPAAPPAPSRSAAALAPATATATTGSITASATTPTTRSPRRRRKRDGVPITRPPRGPQPGAQARALQQLLARRPELLGVVAGILKVSPLAVREILAGRVGLAPSTWQGLWSRLRVAS